MKKTLWIAIVGALAASVVAASAQEVLSANAVGYIKKTLPANGKLVMVAVPLNSMTETDIVFGRSSVAQEAPVNSVVYFWDTVNQRWSPGNKTTKGWGALSNRVVASGEGFFLQGPPTTNYNVDVTITGEVPESNTRARSLPGAGALGTVGNPFPVDFKFGESGLAVNATTNSVVYFWDETNQRWSPGNKTSKGWGAFSNRVVLAGEGFFLQEAAGITTWTNIRPYTWPHE